jgi:DNA-binding transcriptional MerR regulator
VTTRRQYVRAAVFARDLEVTARTVRAWIRRGVVRGAVVNGRYYVERAEYDRMLAKLSIRPVK